jgi:hypothetical protein
MSRDLKEIIDLDHVRRLWGDDGRKPAASTRSVEPVVVPPPRRMRPIELLVELETALTEEFDGQKRPLFQPTLEAIRALVTIGGMSELDAERSVDLGRHLDELEDLLDSFSFSTEAPPAAS